MQPIMKVDRLETHDRLEHLKKQDFDISACCQDMIKQRPFGNHPFYIFAHTRTDDDGVKQRMLWQPRLTKPKAQTNSMLFKVYPGMDIINIIWIIPKKELWDQYGKGKMLENEMVCQCIHDYNFNRRELEAPDKDDLPDEKINEIYKEISAEANRKKMMKEIEKTKSCLILPWPQQLL